MKMTSKFLGLSSIIILTVLVISQTSGCTGASCKVVTADTDKKESVEQNYGIDIQGIRLSAAGRMIDFRYRITDPEKAKQLLGGERKAYLVDHVSGMTLAVPNTAKVGPIRSVTEQLKKDKIYFMFFGNTGRIVKSGNKVTVVIGDIEFSELIVS